MSRGAVEGRGDTITVAIPCRADEPSLGLVIDEVLTTQRAGLAGVGALELLVGINGARRGTTCPPLSALREGCSRHGVPLSEVWVEPGVTPGPVAVRATVSARALLTPVEGKARAWNLLRGACAGDPVLVCDADVTFGPDTFERLYAGLRLRPELVLYSPKTDCIHSGGLLERILAVPYGLDFRNLSGQLYAMRPDRVPRLMPVDLLEPERWLELEVGPQYMGRDPAARVYVRLTATLADFFRQRVRIEMGKIQLAGVYPNLLARSNTQPRGHAVLARPPLEQVALVLYLLLRGMAHAWAWWRYHRGRIQGIWRQPVTTKRGIPLR